MVQQVRVSDALAEVLGSGPSTHKASDSLLHVTPVPGDMTSSSGFLGNQACM